MDPKSISSPYLAMMAPSACSSGGPGWGEQGRDLGKVPLEPRGRDYLKRPRQRLARLPEGLRHAPWLEDQVGDEVRVARPGPRPGRRPNLRAPWCIRPHAHGC